MNERSKLKPLSWGPSLLILLIIAATYYVTHYMLVPAYTQRTGHPYLVGYLWGWGVNMGLIFAVSLIAYRLEGHPTSWPAFST